MSPITASSLCRQMICLLAAPLGARYIDGKPPDRSVLSQTSLTIRMEPKELLAPIDDIIDKCLIPCVAPFLAAMIRKDAHCCYDLELTSRALSSARHQFNGMSLRVIQMPLFSDAVFGEMFVPQSDWHKFNPEGYEFRFDVLHSPRLDKAMAA